MPNILFASDYDNTLTVNGEIPKYNIDAIKRFRKQGNYFAIVTGRGRPMLPKAMEEFCDFYICSSGSCISDVKGNYYNRQLMDKDTIDFVVDTIKAYDATVVVLHGQEAFSVDYTDKASKQFIERFDKSVTGNKVNYKKLNEIFQVSCNIEDNNKHEIAMNIINNSLKADAKGNFISIDITAPNIDKAKGISILNDYFHFSHIYTIGDGNNDLKMNMMYDSFAIETGSETLKQNSKRIIKSVAEAIDNIVGIV